MILTTTSTLQNKDIKEYIWVVSGEIVIGANVIKDFFAGLTDIFGGRSNSYEWVFQEARENAMRELEEKAKKMWADAVIAIDIDYETLGATNSIIMVTATGTAVKF